MRANNRAASSSGSCPSAISAVAPCVTADQVKYCRVVDALIDSVREAEEQARKQRQSANASHGHGAQRGRGGSRGRGDRGRGRGGARRGA